MGSGAHFVSATGSDFSCNESNQTLSLSSPPSFLGFSRQGRPPSQLSPHPTMHTKREPPERSAGDAIFRACAPEAPALLPPRAEAAAGCPAATRKVGGRVRSSRPTPSLGAGYIESHVWEPREQQRGSEQLERLQHLREDPDHQPVSHPH